MLEDPDITYAVSCIHILLDAGVIPYLRRHAPALASMRPSATKVRQSAGLLRHLRGAWIALGGYARDAVSPFEAHALFQRWSAPLVGAPQGDATLATLLARSRGSLLLEGAAATADDVRAQLEALSCVQTDDIMEAELIATTQRVRASDALASLRDPPLHEVFIRPRPRACCPVCGLPLGALAAETERCLECGSSLAA